MAQAHTLGLDIGSKTIKAVIAEPSLRGKMILHAGLTEPSRGIRRGVVVDMESATSAVSSLLRKVKEISKSAHKNIYLKVGGADIKVQSSRGITAVSRANSEIYKDDIDKVLQASEAVNLPPNRMVLHRIEKEFIVDGVGDIQDPMGMTGSRLEVVSLIIDAFQPTVKNLRKCVELAGGSIGGFVFGPIASAEAVLTNSQKDLGSIAIDIGYGTMGIAVYEENKLLHTKVFPVGAGHITNDLALTLQIPVETAEKIKLAYGYAYSRGVSNRDKIDLKKIDNNSTGMPSRKFVAEIIESRLVEMCELINHELREIGKEKQLPAGAVVTGGGSKLPGIVDLMRDELRLTVQIGLSNRAFFDTDSPSVIKFLESPEYSTVLGLVAWSNPLMSRHSFMSDDVAGKFVRFLKVFRP